MRQDTAVVGGRQDGPTTELLLRFARSGHDAGYPTADLEERVLALARSFELEDVEISATPTVVEVAVGPVPIQRSYTLRVRPAIVDLDGIARLDTLVQDVVDGELDATGALARLSEIRAEPLERPWPILLAAYALAGAALTPVLGGGWREAVAGALVGLVVGGIALPARGAARTEPVVAPVAAVAASFCAVSLAQLGLEASPDVVTLAALVTFLPGMTLTIGMRELATEHLQSGVANTASALVQLLGLVFGVGVGRSIAVSWFGSVGGSTPDTAFAIVHLLAAVAAGIAFTVTLRARSRDATVMGAATVLALTANELGALAFGTDASAFVAALVVGVVGGVAGSLLRRSSLVFVVPGVLMLVPGSAGFNSALQLLANQTVSGITAGFDTFVTAMSIAYGLMIATVILPRRFTSIQPARVAGTAPGESAS
ncbi:MAG TPA: threonine/serine exporter family protein [Gaiella sp.]|nr:threonine/serine exporter family protein [Gaiella sp.]